MRRRLLLLFLFVLFGSALRTRATVFGTVRGIVHDPQHRPIAGASVQIKSSTSDWSMSASTDANGEFSFPAVPLGDYAVTAVAPGFSKTQESITLASDTSSVLHFMLSIATVSEKTVVTAEAGTSALQTVTPTTLVNRQNILNAPGADSTNSLAMIADFTPGVYMTHDMLHMRGGHQTTWLIDGVPILTRTSPPALHRASTRKTLTTSRFFVAATTRSTAIGPTASSTSCRNPALI